MLKLTLVHKNCTLKYCLCRDITWLDIKTRIQVAIFPLAYKGKIAVFCCEEKAEKN